MSSDSSVDVLRLLSVAYGGSKDERTAATAQLEAVFQSPAAPQHLLTLLQAGMNPSLPAAESRSALLYAKNCLLHTVPDEVISGSPGLLKEIERVLFDGVFAVPETHRRAICDCAMTLISGFEWNYLPQLMPIVVSEAHVARSHAESAAGATPTPASSAAERGLATLEMLHTYTQRFTTPGLEPMAGKLEVCSALVEVLPSFLAYNDFRVSRYVFKVMECVTETALQSTTEREMPKNALDGWFAGLAAFPEQHYQRAFAAGSQTYEDYVKCVKRIAQITFSVLNDATRRKKPAPVAAHFLKSGQAVTFFAVWRQWLQTCTTFLGKPHDAAAAALLSVHKDSEMYAIRYLKLCTLDEGLYRQHLRPNAIAVIEHLLFPYLCYGEDDAEIFNDEENLSEYVQYMIEEGFGNAELSQRQAASNAILALIGGKKPFHDSSALLQQVLAVLTTGLSLDTNEANFPRLFGFLQLLSILRKYLRQIPEVWNGQMALVLMQFVAPRLQPSVPFVALRCKALVVCQRYSKAPMAREDDFASFVGMMCQLVQDADPRVRLGAIDAMCTLLDMKRARAYLKPVLVPLVQECMRFLTRVQTTFVPTVILHLTTHFAPELTPVMGELGSTLVQHFLATAFDLARLEEDVTLDEDNIGSMENAAFSAEALLDAVYTIVLSSSENKAAFFAMRPDLIRLTRSVLERPDSFDFMEKTLAIFLHVVNFSGADITQQMWDILPLLFNSIDHGVGVDFFNSIEEVLDNFISGATVAYLSNSTVMEATLGACTKMLTGGVYCEPECRMAAAQLFEAMFHQAKSCASHPGLLDPYVPRIVGLLLQALVHPDTAADEGPRLRIWIIAAVMDALYYNAQLTLQVMVQAGAYPQFFDGLFFFFRGCMPALHVGAPASATSDVRAAKKKKKTGKKSGKTAGTEAEAQETVDALSILTRKVIVLGLTSLLSCLFGQAELPTVLSQLRDAFLQQQHEAQTVALVQYCLFANEELYVARCKVSEENISKVRAGPDAEDDVEDVDVGDDEVLGLDGGDDADGVYEDISDVDEWDEDGEGGGGGLAGTAPDEGDDYESPIDDINEVAFFMGWLAQRDQLPAPARQQTDALLKPEAVYAEASNVAAKYRRLCTELQTAMEDDFKRRSAMATN